MVRAVIDIGSNSTLLLIAKLSDDGELIELENESEVTALGKDLDKSGVFCDESMDLARNVLSKYKKLIDKHNIATRNVWISATEASRVAKNASTFYNEIKNTLGLSVSIITGDGEAHYTALGVANGLKKTNDKTIIMDVGGASTEFIEINQYDGFRIKKSISIPIGSVRATDWLGKSGEEFLYKKIDEHLSDVVKDYRSSEIVAVAGTMTSLAAMLKKTQIFEASKIHNSECTMKELILLEEHIASLSSQEILKKFPFLGKRAETIYGGLKVIIRVGSFLNVEKFTVSTYGLRYGVFLAGGIDERYIQ